MADPTEEELRALGVEDDDAALAALGVVDEAAPSGPFAGSAAGGGGDLVRKGRVPGAGESFVQGVGNAFGTGDLMGAALQSDLQGLSDAGAVLSGEMPLSEQRARRFETFLSALGENRRLSAAGMEHHPVSSISGRVVPSILLGPAMGAARTLGASGVAGGVMGAAEGAANSEWNTAEEGISDIDTGAATGALGGMAGYGLGKYVLAPAGAWVGQKLGRLLSRNADDLTEGLEDFAQERALKAVGYIQKDLPDTPAAMEALRQRGQRLLDEPGLIRTGSSAAAIGDRAEVLRKAAGEKIGSYLSQADEAADAAFHGASANPVRYAAEAERLRDAGQWVGGGGHFNPQQLAEQARAPGGVVDDALRDPNNLQQGQIMNDWLDNALDTERVLAARGEPFSFARANEYKGGLQESIYNNKGLVKPNKEVANEFQRLVVGAIDDQAEPLIGSEAVAGFRTARQRFGDFSEVTKRAAQQSNREVGNNFLGLKDMQAAQIAAEMGTGVPGTASVGLLSKLLRGRMDSTAARTADALAKSDTLARFAAMSPEAVGGIGAAVGGAAGHAVADWLSATVSTQPDALGPYAEQLQSAAASGRLPLVHWHLQQTDPQYRMLLEEARKGGEQ